MDPLTLTGSFATIMGLVCNFASEHRASTNDEYNEFMMWLLNNHHNEIRDLIISNKQLSSGLAWISTAHKLLTCNSFAIRSGGQIRCFQASPC